MNGSSGAAPEWPRECAACRNSRRSGVVEATGTARFFCNAQCQRDFYGQPGSHMLTMVVGENKGFWGDLDTLASMNTHFRHIVFTAPGVMQVGAMCILPEEVDIGLERHHEAQYFNIVKGRGYALVDDVRVDLAPGKTLWVMPGVAHNIVVAPDATEPLRLFTTYTPPHHAPGTLHPRKRDVPASDED